MEVQYHRCKKCGHIFEESDKCPLCGEEVDKSVNVTSEGGSIKISLINDEAYMSGKAQKICEGNLEV